MTGIFLLGTDTGVGKTTLACALLHLARLRGFPLVPYKPAETGCNPLPDDAVRLLNACGHPELTAEDICPYPLRTPVAPSVAARLDGRNIDPQLLVARAHSLARGGRALLGEGAGGLLTPYGAGLDGAALAKLLDLDVVLVAANRLGTISQTLLALEALDRRHLRCVGLVLVNVNASPGPDTASNSSEIADISGHIPLGTLRFLTDPTPAALAQAASVDLDLTPILGGALRSPSDASQRDARASGTPAPNPPDPISPKKPAGK